MNLPVIFTNHGGLMADPVAVDAMKTALLQLKPGSTPENYRFVFRASEEARAEGLEDIVLTLEDHALSTLAELADMADKLRSGETLLGPEALQALALEAEQGIGLSSLYLQAYRQGEQDHQLITGRA